MNQKKTKKIQINKIKIIVIISFIILCFCNPIFARYYETVENITVRGTIDEKFKE